MLRKIINSALALVLISVSAAASADIIYTFSSNDCSGNHTTFLLGFNNDHLACQRLSGNGNIRTSMSALLGGICIGRIELLQISYAAECP